jgi:L,D-peptidoglycan transpeptidase YkuD (ErfK/YbiS/YcfS/YnhG family)
MLPVRAAGVPPTAAVRSAVRVRAPARAQITTPPRRRTTTVTSLSAPPPLLVERLSVGAAQQVITVTSSSWSSSSATLQAFEKDGDGWRAFTGPVPVFVGVHGFSADKREGDGKTPAGTYGFQLMFGTAPDPGVRYQFRRAGPSDVWVDDPSSAFYNTWQQDPADGRWASAESLDQPAPYHEAAAVAYNADRVPGRGSAIFLHVSLGRPTAGCVAVNETVLLQLLRWLDPARAPVIVMGPTAFVER